MKFNILIPAYNVEDYIDDCLNSIINQTYQNFKIIIINDASIDNTEKHIKKWLTKYPEKFTYIKHKENNQISITRNELINKVDSDYFIFVDSDDIIGIHLLEEINKIAIKDSYPDLIHYGLQHIDNNKNIINNNVKLVDFHNTSGPDAFKILYENYNVLESPCLYAYKTEYIKKNKFKYYNHKNHEDFGLTPLIILSSKKISSIPIIGYYYIQKENSIMRNSDIKLIEKNSHDLLFQYDFLLKKLKKYFDDKYLKHYLSLYLVNPLFYRARILNGKLKKDFINELKKRKPENIYFPIKYKEKLRHIIMKISYNLYIYIYYYKKIK